MTRKKWMKFRVNDDERKRIIERVPDGEPVQTHLRELCLSGKRPKPRPVPTCPPELALQLAGIGNNINQIARGLNTALKNKEPVSYSKLLIALNRQKEYLRILAEHDYVS